MKQLLLASLNQSRVESRTMHHQNFWFFLIFLILFSFERLPRFCWGTRTDTCSVVNPISCSCQTTIMSVWREVVSSCLRLWYRFQECFRCQVLLINYLRYCVTSTGDNVRYSNERKTSKWKITNVQGGVGSSLKVTKSRVYECHLSLVKTWTHYKLPCNYYISNKPIKA